MAFDFVSYIGQQVEQQQPQLLASQAKAERKQFVTHLLAFQVAELISAQKKNADAVYAQIQNQDVEPLSTRTYSHIQNEEKAQQYFAPIQPELQSTNHDIAQIFLQELQHLDQSASLGQSGIAELINGQQHWLQVHADAWFWDSIGQPENKRAEDIEAEQAVDSQQVMKEFSQMINQNAQHNAHPTDCDHAHQNANQTVELAPATQASKVYLFLNPLIALAIIIFIYKVLF
ncbi:MAG: hypothetical protein VX875_08760 [Pseudomonadota bacterium]|nr:hypothetical protein [Pseudomonadota bacterium]